MPRYVSDRLVRRLAREVLKQPGRPAMVGCVFFVMQPDGSYNVELACCADEFVPEMHDALRRIVAESERRHGECCISAQTLTRSPPRRVGGKKNY